MKLNVLVGDVMTRNIKYVDINDPIEKAAKIMRDESIGSVVVTGEKNVKGIVTTTDIVYKHVASRRGNRVADIMSQDIVSIHPSATIEAAARLMVKNGVEKLLVFDGNSLVGIITNNDIIRTEPAIVEILLENMKIGANERSEYASIDQCESCGNYADDLEPVDGVYLCTECRGN